MKLKKIEWAKVRFLSLCLDGKNQLKGLYKAKDEGRVFVRPLAKADGEQGLLAVCVYPPDTAGIVDEEGEVASAEVIRQFAHDAMANGIELDIYHNGEPIPRDQAAIVESFIIQPGDPRFDGMPGPNGVVNADQLAGGWGAVIHLKTEEMREQWRDGAISMGGEYMTKEVETEPMQKASKASLLASFRRALRGVFKKNTDGGLRDVSMNVRLPRPGETDYDGNPSRPSFHISLSGDLTQD